MTTQIDLARRKTMISEPYFDIVEEEFPRHDPWACFMRLFGMNLTRKIPQIKWRPGGMERAQRAITTYYRS
jgi:hypothetical protein